jgi:succinate dehydrogenase flavin-adding protein (antitoxin of CptAB toxin-antitoxin module)
MSPFLLRQIWSLVEATQTQVLLNLDDETLVQWLLRQLKARRSLDSQETDLLNTYLQSRLPLIRDLAQSRRALG